MVKYKTLSLVFSGLLLLAATGCQKHLISPREMANENPDFTAQKKYNGLVVKAKQLDEKEFDRLFENNGRGFIPFDLSPKLIRKKYRVGLLTFQNKTGHEYTAQAIGGTVAAKSEVMPQFSHHEETILEQEEKPAFESNYLDRNYHQRDYLNPKDLPGEEKPRQKSYTSKTKTISYVRSDNGLSRKDAETLNTFGLFSDRGKNTVTISPYNKEVKIVFMTKKDVTARYKIKLALKDHQEGGLKQVTLVI
jgi:hypothetical protein